jgi:type 1 glutamine amidotransferase
MAVSRRQVLIASGAALLGPAVAARLRAGSLAPKKVLFFTKSSGFEHSAIHRDGDKLGYAEKVLQDVGKTHGFDVVCSKDGGLFAPDKIGEWDAFVFYTTGDLTKPGTDKQPPITDDGLKAFIDRIHSGKAGFVGVHSATDTLGDHRGLGDKDPYTQMIGGQFHGHGAQQEVELIVTDPHFPGTTGLKDRFKITDEWYSQKYQPSDLHVIIAHNTGTMKGGDYARPNYPQTWAKAFGNGRVYYNSMGHREDVWDNPIYQGLVLGGLTWATGQADIDTSPNVQKFTPDFQTLQKK